MSAKSHSVALGVVGLLSLGANASAQGHRPANGVFMSAAPAKPSGQRADFTVSSTQGHDNGGSVSQVEFAGPNQQPTGASTALSVAGNYGWLGRWAQLSANGTLRFQQYHSVGSALTSSTSADRDATVRLSRKSGRNTFAAVQTGAYSSAAVLSFFPQLPIGDEAPVMPAVTAGNNLERWSYGTGLAYSRQLAERSSLRITAERQQSTTVPTVGAAQRMVVYGVRDDLSRSIRRHVVLTFGYGYRYGDFGYDLAERRRKSSEHTLDVGLDWTRPLSATRTISASGRVGGTTSMLPRLQDGAVVESRFDRVSGQLAFGYEFGRSWRTSASYRRGLEYIAGLNQPVFSDSVTTSVDGLITRRLDATVSAGFSSGASAQNRGGLTFDTYTGSAVLRFAITRSFAAFTDYVYYDYKTRGVALLPVGIPRQLHRNTVRAGLTLNVRPLGR